MREDNISIVKYQTSVQRTERIKRNRQIRKERLYGKTFPIEQLEQKPSNRDDKMHVQKLKNRQAAQKSRQQKKLYVTQLEEQIKYLKHRLANLRHCQNCQKQLQVFPLQSQNTHEQTNSRRQNETTEFDQEQSSFIRVSSTEQNSSIGIYLFVFMVILGVFCIGSRVDGQNAFNPMKRDLTQLYSLAQDFQSKPVDAPYQWETNMKSTYSTQQTERQKNQNGLLSMDQVKSPTLIADQQQFERIITSFENYKIDKYDDKNLRSKVGLIDANKSLLFCTRPKIYKSNNSNQGIITAFIDIFVRGAQIINIFPSTTEANPNSGNFQLNGLYKITASVQEIQEIGNYNAIY